MVTITLAAATTSSVTGLGNSSARSIPSSDITWTTAGSRPSAGVDPLRSGGRRPDRERGVEVRVAVVHEMALGAHLCPPHEAIGIDPQLEPDRDLALLGEECEHLSLDPVQIGRP